LETYLICLAAALIGGLMLSRVTKRMNLPAVTAYLVAGLLLGPFGLGALKLPGLGFNSLEQVEHLSIITQTALGFIAFTIGNEFRLRQLKSMGKNAVIIGILQAVITTAVVDIVLIGLHLCFPSVISIPCAITLGAIASATAPAATLMVVRQYKADGPLTRLLMLVVAIDDAVGLVLFSVSYGIATALSAGQISVLAVVVEPIVEILLSLVLGSLMGWLLNWVEQFFHSRSKRMTISVAFVLLTVGLSSLKFQVGGIHCGFSLLQHLSHLRRTDGTCGQLGDASEYPLLRHFRRRTGSGGAGPSGDHSGRHRLYHRPLRRQILRLCCQLRPYKAA